PTGRASRPSSAACPDSPRRLRSLRRKENRLGGDLSPGSVAATRCTGADGQLVDDRSPADEAGESAHLATTHPGAPTPPQMEPIERAEAEWTNTRRSPSRPRPGTRRWP